MFAGDAPGFGCDIFLCCAAGLASQAHERNITWWESCRKENYNFPTPARNWDVVMLFPATFLLYNASLPRKPHNQHREHHNQTSQ
jgi:hypothetical protein